MIAAASPPVALARVTPSTRAAGRLQRRRAGGLFATSRQVALGRNAHRLGMGVMNETAFDAGFREAFAALLAWRRDVRRFRTEPVDEALLDHLLDLACLAPSVGNSRPWRFVRVDDPARRAAVRADFARCNAAALAAQIGRASCRERVYTKV